MAARNDTLLCSFGALAYARHGNEQNMHQVISQKMRQLARLLLGARKLSSDVVHLTDLIDASKFSLVPQVVQNVGGFSADTNSYDRPSVCLKLGHAIKKGATICKSNAMQSGNTELRRKAQGFLELCELQWTDAVLPAALRTLVQRQWNNPKRLPLAEDVAKLTAYLHQEIEEAKTKLAMSDSNPGDWRSLARLTLVQVMLFNRRRSGEVERVPQAAYEKRSTSVDSDVMSVLSSWEQHLCKSLARFEVRGKRGRKIPILLT
jgi:hypothetical protein